MNQITGEWRKKKKEGLKKIKGYTPTKQKTEKLQQRGKQLLLFRKENTQSIQESNKINITSHSRFVEKPRTSTEV